MSFSLSNSGRYFFASGGVNYRQSDYKATVTPGATGDTDFAALGQHMIHDRFHTNTATRIFIYVFCGTKTFVKN
jgi:hypothetical protein